MIFFTSDWHIGHKNILDYDQRPFRDLDHMHKVLINNYNSCVKENMTCYFLGDMGLCKGDIIKDVIKQLQGTKVLILGNHDKGSNAMRDYGFDVVLNSAIFYIGSKRVSMSHCPLPNIKRECIVDMKGATEGENWHGESRQQRFTSQDSTVDFHLHGHIHSPNGGKSETLLGRQYDVGVAANSYRPVSLSFIESLVSKGVV